MGLLRDFLRWIYTGFEGCAVCGDFNLAGNLQFCFQCLDKIDFIQENYCQRCGRYLGQEAASSLCEYCKEEELFTAGRSLALYQGLLRCLLLELKFSGRRELATPLGSLLCIAAKKTFDNLDLIIPIPLSKKRLRVRGYNQSLLLAVPVAKKLGIEINPGILYRIKDTLPQSFLDMQARQQNIGGAFGLRSPAKIRGKKILLVDDIITTGATAREAARVLHRGSPAGVSILTLAATVPGKRANY